MLDVMEQTQVRMVLVVDEEIRDALKLESALSKKDMADIVADYVREHLSDALEQIRKRRTIRERNKRTSEK